MSYTPGLTNAELSANQTQFQQCLVGNVNLGDGTRKFRYAFGQNTGVNNALVDLEGYASGTYVFPASAQQMRVVSTSANDTAAGTGVQSVHLHYLDDAGHEQFEVITMNGTTPVNTTATNILRNNGLHSWTVGTGGAPAGNISLTNLAGTITYGYMSAGLNTALNAHFTVPTGYSYYINKWKMGSGSSAANNFTKYFLRATAHYGVLIPGVFITHDLMAGQDGTYDVSETTPIALPAGTDIKLSAVSDGAAVNATVVGSFHGWIEANA